ncbi:MAG: hypothetical protein ABI729_09875 [Chitinophagales bacterium]
MEKKDINWNIVISEIPFGDFDHLEIKPVRFYSEDNSSFCETCEPHEADIWSIYIRLLDGRALSIADCADKQTATVLFNLLERLLHHWRIRVLITIEDANIASIHATRLLEIAKVDYDLFEEDDYPADLVTIEPVVLPAVSGEFYKSVAHYDNNAQIVTEVLKRLKF